MSRKPTIYEVLVSTLRREPTPAELKAEVQRIIHEGTIEGMKRKVRAAS